MSSHRRGVHRRRIRHHRCFAKAAIAIALLPLLVFAAYFISKRPHTYRYNFPGAHDLEWAGGNASENLAALAGRVAPAPPVRRGRLVYPYSVIPGGVRDGNELREAIQRDRAAARHYAGFDFQKAHIVQLKSPKLVFLSYRLRDKIYWTRKQIKLSEGERLITDGKVAARTRCANQVSVLPQAAVSTEEPLAEQLEDPFGVGGSATQIDFPGSFESALLRRTPPGLGGEGPGSGLFGSPFGGGGPGLSPPPIPSGCAKPPCSTTPTPPPPPPPPAPVPEPGSILLVSFGLAGIYFRYRKRASKN